MLTSVGLLFSRSALCKEQRELFQRKKKEGRRERESLLQNLFTRRDQDQKRLEILSLLSYVVAGRGRAEIRAPEDTRQDTTTATADSSLPSPHNTHKLIPAPSLLDQT